MSPQTKKSGSPQSRVALYAFALLLIGGSLTAGYYLPGNVLELVGLSSPPPDGAPCCCAEMAAGKSALPPCCAAKLAEEQEAAPAVTEYPLSDLDRKDSIEAPTLTMDDSGRVFVAWASQTESQERTLFLASSLNGGKSFDPPRPVKKSAIYSFQAESKGKTITRSIRMIPHLVATEGKLHLSWQAAANENTTVKMMLAESADGGLSFAPPICLHHSEQARPTFTSLAAGADGSLAAAWLDNRSGVQQPTLAARVGAESQWREETQIPAGEEGKGICPCCPHRDAHSAGRHGVRCVS